MYIEFAEESLLGLLVVEGIDDIFDGDWTGIMFSKLQRLSDPMSSRVSFERMAGSSKLVVLRSSGDEVR
jgi:hypothetical protein